MASLLPIYMKHYYKNEALFSDTKVVISVYGQSFDGTLNPELINKMLFDNIPSESLGSIEHPSYENIIQTAINHSDGVIVGSELLTESLTKYIETSGKPFLPFAPKDQFAEAYTGFYGKILS
jgi:starch synthase